jgi:hypothetical protein
MNGQKRGNGTDEKGHFIFRPHMPGKQKDGDTSPPAVSPLLIIIS